LLADVALLNSWRFRIGWTDVSTVISQARQLLGCHPVIAADEYERAAHQAHVDGAPLSPSRTVWLLNELTAAEIWTAQLAFAAVHNREALSGASVLGHSRLLAAARINRGLLHLAQGRGQDAAADAQLGLTLLREHSRQEPVLSARAQLIISWQQINELYLAEAAEGIALLSQRHLPTSDPIVDVTTGMFRAFLTAEFGNHAAARRDLADLVQTAGSLPVAYQRTVRVFQARWAWTTRDLPELQHQTQLLQAAGWHLEYQVFSAACIGLDQDAATAIGRLDDLLAGPLGDSESALAAMAAAARYQFLVHAAGSLEAVGDPRVFRAFYDLLDRIQPQQRLEIITFLDTSDATLLELLRKDAARHAPHPITPLLLDALARYRRSRRANASMAVQTYTPEDEPASQARIARSLPLTGHIPPLSTRELEVLRELALGGSYAEIAGALYITPNTVKTHVLHIYRKLGVERRGEALRRARELGLIT
jgi:ATP/maltotriose-dependent transcriptional regulator MalT